jgi:hypothetical protein
LPASNLAKITCGAGENGLAIKQDIPAGDVGRRLRQQSGQRQSGYALSAPALSHNGKSLAITNNERDRLDSREFFALGDELYG